MGWKSEKDESMTVLAMECAEYLKSKSGLYQLAMACINKYEHLEYIGGSIQLKNVSSEELSDIGAFLGKHLKHDSRISLLSIVQAIEHTRFAGCDLIQVLRIIKGEEFVFQHREKQKEEAMFSSFCDNLEQFYAATKAADWLKMIIEQKGYLLRQIKEMWKQDPQKLSWILQAVNELPVWKDRRELVAVFAQRISKDPHFFDEGIQERMLLSAISFYFCKNRDVDSELKKTEILYRGGLIKDDMSNFCMIARISAVDENEVECPAWKGFCETFEPWIVNLYNLNQIHRLKPPESVYIVENPSTFRTLCMFAKEQQLMDVAFVCTYGQLNFSAYVLLDLFDFQYTKVYYHGDFDPEGLLIADKLKKRYPMLNLWHYKKEDYIASLSNNFISDRRMHMLEKLEDDELKRVSVEIKKRKCAGYQESLHELFKLELGNTKIKEI